MVLLITLTALSLLFVSFVWLTMYETARGTRIFSSTRSVIDSRISQLARTFTKAHIGLALLHIVETFVRQLVHEVVHIALVSIRVMERALMRMRARVQQSTLSSRSLYARSHFMEMFAKKKQPPVTKDDTAKNEEVG